MVQPKSSAQAEEMMKRGFITVAEAARRLKLNPGTIYRALATGRLVGTQVGERKYVEEASFVTYSNEWNLAEPVRKKRSTR